MSDRVFLIISTALFLLLSVISVVFFGRERFFTEQSGQFMAEQLGDELYRQWNRGDVLELPDSVLGFHIFTRDGSKVFQIGIPLPKPPDPAPTFGEQDKPGSFPPQRDHRPKSLIPVGQGEFLFQKMLIARRGRDSQSVSAEPRVYVLHISGTDIRQRINFWLLGQALAPILILLLYVSTLIFFFRGRKYRRKLLPSRKKSGPQKSPSP